MAFVFDYTVGVPGELGFPYNDPATLSPQDFTGLELRCRVQLPRQDLIIPAYVTEGELLSPEGGVPFTHTSIVAIRLGEGIFPTDIAPGSYRATLEEQSPAYPGWRPLRGGVFIFRLRKE